MSPRQQRAEETREHILQAAQECFARDGYAATGVAAICRAAGISKGAFYHHFPTKQSLFLELLTRWLAGLDAQVAASRARAGSVPQGLLSMAALARQISHAGRGQLPLFLEFWSQAAHEPAVWAATIEPYRRYRAFFAEMIAAGIDEGSLRPVDADAAARVIVSLAVGMLVQALLDPDAEDWGPVAEQGVDLLLTGLERPKRKP